MADSSDSVPEPVPEPVPTPVNAPHTEPLSEPIPEAEHDVTNGSAVEEHNVSNVPITGEQEATKPVSERAEDGSGPPATPREPVIVGYAQPDISPYEGKAVTVFIGCRGKFYTIPENLVNRATTLPCRHEVDGSAIVRLPDVDEDIGHTIMHYLYTGDYQTVKPSSISELRKRAMEYARSVFAYRAAVKYGLDGLAEHAKRYIEIFDKEVSINDIISLGRKAFPRISEEPWFSEYLTDRITASFEADEGIFQREQYFEGFGESVDFDKFLGKVMAQAYSSKISAIRRETEPCGGVNKKTMPNVGGEEIASSDCNVSVTQASSTEGDLYS
ncbi:hypothetical protein CNMCM8980_000114 [Aspergillus fumigatiaffinis]|uniref:BTB domain-containing protein n=1 Tax=Aspergillus fumigatiaffinis TaxID=340414 RepID=A0A8H4GVD2_9EURO|nr:hypothetical protein CNMCM6805_001846 [Aspergillus fumigatiaffinis]KAF4243207.1 hypothetical protein CNMCM8980_000114 [Aspergillus fumigatiaffinis]